MRRKLRTIFAIIGLSAIAATASSDGSSFSYGTMQASCAPWDGPAIEMRLTTEPAQCKRTGEPFISIAIWRGLPIQEGQTVKIDSGSGIGSAAHCRKEGECTRAQSATIIFDRYKEKSGAQGRYELQFKGGETIKGSFEVKWCEERVFCG